MSNITAPRDAESVSFDPHREKEALAAIIADADIATSDDAPLPDEDYRSNQSQAEARKHLDPVVADQLEETRLPDEIAFDGQRQAAGEEFDGAVSAEIGRRKQVVNTFERNTQNYAAEVDDFYNTVMDPNLPLSTSLAGAAMHAPDGPKLLYALANDPARLDEANEMAESGNAGAALNLVRRDLGLSPRSNVTNAPPVVPTLSGGGASVQRSPSNMSMAEYTRGRLSGKIK